MTTPTAAEAPLDMRATLYALFAIAVIVYRSVQHIGDIVLDATAAVCAVTHAAIRTHQANVSAAQHAR